MINLIKNEIFKIFKKKGIWIILIVLFIYIFFISFINYKMVNKSFNINELKETLKSIDIENDLYLYVDTLSQIEKYELLKNYDKDSWQYYIINNNGYEYITYINNLKYVEKDLKELEKANKEFELFKESLKGSWIEYTYKEMRKIENDDPNYEENESYKKLKLRLKYDIPYGNNKLNTALNNFINFSYDNGNKINLDHEDIINRENNEKVYYTSKYMIENKFNEPDDISCRGLLLSFFSTTELFIVVAVCLIASSIISEEFNKGTIKMLLVRPYSRTKILLSKFITVLLSILFMIFVSYFIQLIVGIIFFGPKSLSSGVLIYNYITHNVKEISIFSNILITILCKLPIYIIIGTFAFCFSTFINNTGVSIAISIAFYIGSEIINSIVYYFNIKWIKYIITVNWDFSSYLYGKTPIINGTGFMFSLVICLIYFIIMIIPTFIYFNHKNIKNI